MFQLMTLILPVWGLCHSLPPCGFKMLLIFQKMVHRIDNAMDNQGRIFRGKEGGVDIWICVIEFHKGNELETVKQTECTYWQSDSLAVEQAEMHLLAVCQSC